MTALESRVRDLARRAGRQLRSLRNGPGRRRGPDPVPSGPPDTTSTASMFAWARDRLPERPQYLWGALHAGRVAVALGHQEVALVEMGVAGGHGLLALERAAGIVEDLLSIRVAVAGFDIGSGMPAPVDERDIPWAVQPGILPMDEPALRARLRRAELVLGPVAETVPEWIDRPGPPVGFAAFDLDLYSSTMQAFRLLEGRPDRLLPRVACYFDDIFGYGWSDFAGERAAITDFNQAHERRKISAVHGLHFELAAPDRHLPWPQQVYMAHLFDSADYNRTEWRIPPSWEAAHRLDPGSASA